MMNCLSSSLVGSDKIFVLWLGSLNISRSKGILSMVKKCDQVWTLSAFCLLGTPLHLTCGVLPRVFVGNARPEVWGRFKWVISFGGERQFPSWCCASIFHKKVWEYVYRSIDKVRNERSTETDFGPLSQICYLFRTTRATKDEDLGKRWQFRLSSKKARPLKFCATIILY